MVVQHPDDIEKSPDFNSKKKVHPVDSNEEAFTVYKQDRSEVNQQMIENEDNVTGLENDQGDSKRSMDDIPMISGTATKRRNDALA